MQKKRKVIQYCYETETLLSDSLSDSLIRVLNDNSGKKSYQNNNNILLLPNRRNEVAHVFSLSNLYLFIFFANDNR